MPLPCLDTCAILILNILEEKRSDNSTWVRRLSEIISCIEMCICNSISD